ncbi:LysE family translocator [uncultured Hoeflea sp.]|uniref:LysE family translocator n=1 Tax=uncultured Hoeflea sp. TaxID=538666 RepID=UPI0030D959FE
MPLDTIFALAGFAFVMSVSPGPGNFLLLASGANFGFIRSLPLVLGISLGFLYMVVLVGLGLGQVFDIFPLTGHIIRLTCGIYVVWLAVKMARSGSLGPQGEQPIGKPFSFAQAAALQLVNPKAWTVAFILTASYVDPNRPAASLATLVPIFAFVNLPSISLWAISGKALRRFLGQGQRLFVFNILMAALLVLSMVPVLLGSTS